MDVLTASLGAHSSARLSSRCFRCQADPPPPFCSRACSFSSCPRGTWKVGPSAAAEQRLTWLETPATAPLLSLTGRSLSLLFFHHLWANLLLDRTRERWWKEKVLLYLKQGVIREEEYINKTSCVKSGRLRLSICICLGLAEDRTARAGERRWLREERTELLARPWCCTASRGCHGLPNPCSWQVEEGDSFPSLVPVLCHQFVYLI